MNDVIKIEKKSGEHGELAIATLNAPKALNALNLEMIETLGPLLEEWANDASVRCVILKGEGDHFCAGGDIRALYNGVRPERTDFPEVFFEKEYRLDYAIHRFPKPIIVWGSGVVMGGGMGLMQGSRYRIVSDTSKMAMPEITIGLYPDVGASFFLRKNPNLGKFLSLTAYRLNGAEALHAGLADYFIKEENKNLVLEQLTNIQWTDSSMKNHELLEDFFSEHFDSSAIAEMSNALKDKTDFIESFSAQKTPQDIVKFAQAHADSDDKFIQRSLKTLLSGSPSTIGIIFEQFKRAEDMGLEDCFRMEWCLSVQCAYKHDFPEGIRALIIDKDKNPSWKPAQVSDLKQDWIDSHFVSPRADGSNPLSDLGKQN